MPGAATAARRRLGGLLPLLVLLAAVAAGTGGCRPESPHRAERPNVLLLSIDTLRADHLGAYGYDATPSPSPWIDELASGGRVYEDAVTSAPETAPAVATLLTGLYQDRHGVMYNRRSLEQEPRTLAERLKEHGYETAAFVGNWLVDEKHGFGQGFDRFELVQNPPFGPVTTDDKLVALFGDFARHLPARPWFAWVHMMDPHGPYNGAPPWWSRGFAYPDGSLPSGQGEIPVSDSNFGLGMIPRYQKLEFEKTLADYVRRYDGEIRFTDSQVGALLAMLRASGAAANTLVVLVADHGESLVEHDELLQHGWFVYETTARVPLVLSWPAGLGEATRISGEACGVDVTPTILALAGLDAESADFDGRPLVAPGGVTLGAAAGPGDGVRDAGCFTIGGRANHVVALRSGPYKLIVTPAGTPRDPRAPKNAVSNEDERIELYRVDRERTESVDLSTQRPDVVAEMQQSVALLRSRFRANGWRW